MPTLYESVNDNFINLPLKLYRHELYGLKIHAPLHWHRSLELTVPLSGQVRFNIGSNNLDTGRADWFVANSGELHSCSPADDCGAFVGVSVILSLPFVEKWVGRGISFYNPDRPEVTADIKRLARELFETDERAPENRFRIMSILFELLELLAQHCVRRAEPRAALMESNQLLISRITDHIEAHYQEELSLGDIAAAFKYSPTYFSHMFKDMMGVNFHAYLSYVRVCHAAEELLTGSPTMTDCAFHNGFSNVKSFIAAFKKVFGLTPSAYLESHTGWSSLHAAGHDALDDVLLADQVEDEHRQNA